MLGKTVRWKSWGIEWEADTKHRNFLMERFGCGVNTKALNCNGDNTTHDDNEEEEVPLSKTESTEFRGAAARFNFLSQDCPDLMYPALKRSARKWPDLCWGLGSG